MTVRILPLVRDDPEAWAIMPQALARVRRFCVEHQTDSIGDVLVQTIEAAWIATRPAVRLWAAVAGQQCVGHLLVTIDDWCGRSYATILQYALDCAVPTAMLRKTFDEMAAWAVDMGAREVQLLTHDPRLVRLYRQRWGFRAVRVLMRAPLTGGR